MSIENSDPDRLEQLRPAVYEDTDEEEAEDLPADGIPLDADPSDVADQHRPVPIDDEPLEY